MTLSAANTDIKVGQKVTGVGISGDVVVSAISGTSLTLDTAVSISNGTTLTFTSYFTTFAVAENTPESMFYYCRVHRGMGGVATVLTS